MKKTNAMRILDSASVPYTTLSYEVDEDHLDAVHAASSLGIPAERLFKTIVMTTDNKITAVFCVPAPYEISMKKLKPLVAQAFGAKSADLVPLQSLQKLTGYIRGGCSPLGMIHRYPTFIEESALLYEKIYVSAGIRGTMVCLKSSDLASLTGAQFAALI